MTELSASPPSPPSPPLARSGPLPSSDSVSDLLHTLLPSAECPPESPSPPEIRGVDSSGTAHSAPLTPETDTLALSGLGLSSISLAPLALLPPSATSLRELSLAANALSSIDLAPLALCPTLAVLALNSNALASIDLRPLSALKSLERLWLHDNALTRVDLAPLRFCPALRSLYLDDNQLHHHALDLSPLAFCTHLRSLRVAGNSLNGVLDVTPLLSVPALSQFATAPGVALVATGSSAQARVSPAMRRAVLDISFRDPAAVAEATTTTSASSSSSSSSPSSSPLAPTPPSQTSSAVRPLRSRSGTPPVFSPRPSGTTRTANGAGPATSSALQSPPSPSLGRSSSLSSSLSSLTKQAPTPAPAPAPPPVSVLLIGFRRLARYAAEDALAKCGALCISALGAKSTADEAAISAIAAAHVVVLHAPAPSTLRDVSTAAATAPVPVVVLGPERYRSSNAQLLRDVLGVENIAEAFFPDPPSPSAARRVYALGLARAMRLLEKDAADRGGKDASATPKRGRRRSSSRHEYGARTPPPGLLASPPSFDVAQGASHASGNVPVSAVVGIVGASDSDSEIGDTDDEDDLDDFDVDECGSAKRELASKPARSLWAQVSQRLSLWRRPPGAASGAGTREPRLMLPPSLSSGSLSLSASSLTSPEMLHHSANKLRAERAAVELAFHDLGGSAGLADFAPIARACALPKCAGRLLYRAVFAAAVAVEKTSPEPGVSASRCKSPTMRGGGGAGIDDGLDSRLRADGRTCAGESLAMSPPCVLPARKVSSSLFMQYWDGRLQSFHPEIRLYHVLTDSLGYDEEADQQRQRYLAQLSHIPDAHVSAMSARVLTGGSGSDTVDSPDLYRQSSAGSSSLSSSSLSGAESGPSTPAPVAAPPMDTGSDGIAGLEGCDAAVAELVRSFMQGRSGRFGMFALVKLSEAVSIGTALLLLGLRGECGSRVGGRARPVTAREVCRGRLNASMIAAEAGIFEGVSANLSMDKLRNVKGNYASEAAPEAVVAGDSCALNYSLAEAEVTHYNTQRNLLLPRGVRSLLAVHCHGRHHMTLPEFAVMHTCMTGLASRAGADYFFSIIDADCDEYWSLADLQHFHSEKGRILLLDGMALSGLHEVWACLCDMIRPADEHRGIARSEFLRLSANDRKLAIQSLLFRDDNHATLNIRQTLILEGKSLSDGSVAL